MPVIRELGFAARVWQDPDCLNSTAPCVYCLWDGRYVKIGKTDGHPKLRMRELQTGNPGKLRLVAFTRTLSEKRAHTLLHRDRVRGEWFEPSRDLLKFVWAWDWLDETVFAEIGEA